MLLPPLGRVTPPPRLSWPPRGWTELAASHRNTPTWIHKYRTSLNFCLKRNVCVPTLTGPPRSGFHPPESGAEFCPRSPGGRRWPGRPPSSTGPGSAEAGSRRSGPGGHRSRVKMVSTLSSTHQVDDQRRDEDGDPAHNLAQRHALAADHSGEYLTAVL